MLKEIFVIFTLCLSTFLGGSSSEPDAADQSQVFTQQQYLKKSIRLLQQQRQVAPIITPLAAPLQAESGSRAALPPITDTNGSPSIVSWKLVTQDQKTIRTGVGGIITLPNVPPGQYTILVTADDGQLQSQGEYTLLVRQPGTQPASSAAGVLAQTSTTSAAPAAPKLASVAATSALAAAALPPSGPTKPPVLPIVTGRLEGSAGGSITLPAVSDPSGGPVQLSWNLLDTGARQRVASGRGSTVSLAEVAAGTYTLNVVANNGKLTAAGSYPVVVRKVGDVPAVATSSSSSGDGGSSSSASPSSNRAPVMPGLKEPLQGDPALSSQFKSQQVPPKSAVKSSPAPVSPTTTSSSGAPKQQQQQQQVTAAAVTKTQAGGANQAPVIPKLKGGLTAKTGDRVNLPSITDPEGNSVNVSWKIRRSGKGIIRTGVGGVLTLTKIPGGDYTVVVTATDGSQASSTAIYHLKVTS